MTAGGRGRAWVASADALAPRWWLEERQVVDACQLVLMVEVSPSVGSS